MSSAVYIALNRFGLGARPNEALTLDDPKAWLLEQLSGSPPMLSLPSPSNRSISANLAAFLSSRSEGNPEALQESRAEIFSLVNGEVSNLLTTRITSERPFVERWIAFWSNHLCVSSGAGIRVSATAGAYEREVIRPNVFGRFEDMLLASARHPSMLFYLNNVQSIGPNSRAGKRSGRGNAPLGLNENYARELLELHSLGVDGGYEQTDVEELAKILTGWGVEGLPGGRGRTANEIGFRFLNPAHEPGRKEVLGKRYAEAGEEEGIRVIRDLARNPSTARFLATKIAQHFIDDNPPEAVINSLTATWQNSEGDLLEVARALVQLDIAWDQTYRKFRTPQDWLVAVFRALNAETAPPNLNQILAQLNHALWAPSAPKGYGDLGREWDDPDSLLNRAELSQTIADRVAGSTGRARNNLLPEFIGSVIEINASDTLSDLLADNSIAVSERLALAFAGPAFQWR